MSQIKIPPTLILLFLLLNGVEVFSQKLSTVTYRDSLIPRAEPSPDFYDFIYPVEKDFYDLPDYTPPADGRFFVQNYGPRYIGTYDNHQGSDIWGRTVHNGVLTFNPPALCMCDGEVVSIINGTDEEMESTTSGRTIRIRCTKESQVFESPINIIFRHLDSIDVNLVENQAVAKGDTLGFVGETGSTSLSHLHFDYYGVPNQWGNSSSLKYLNPMRLFDPAEHPHVIGKLEQADIEILHDWQDSTLIRIHWPHNQHINRFEFTNGDYNLVLDLEEVRASYAVYEPSIWVRDSMKTFPSRFNGFNSTLHYQNTNPYPAYFTNSPSRDTNLVEFGYPHIPYTADSVVNAYDFILENVPSSHLTKDWNVKLSDVWGFVIEGTPDCSTTVSNLTNWGAGSLRAAINCAEQNDTIFFDTALNNSTLEVDLPMIKIDKTLYFKASSNQNVTVSNKGTVANQVLFSLSDEMHILGLQIVGNSGGIMVLKVEAGGSITVHTGSLQNAEIKTN